jgi:CDGSH-type Zn-finger protein
MSTQIKKAKGGPYLVTGDIELIDKDGNAVECEPGKTIAFCACGASTNKPFCDGKHRNLPDGWDGNG